MNNHVLSGKLMNDFKIQKVGDKNVAKGTLSVNKGLSKEMREQFKASGKKTSNYIQIEVWGSDAKIKFLTDNVMKDSKLTVIGSVQTGSYTKKGTDIKVYTTVLNVKEFEFEYNTKENYDEIEI